MEGPTKFNLSLKWGGIMGALLIIVSLMFYLTGMVDMETGKSGILSNILNYVISIGAIVMAMREFKQSQVNNLTVGEGVVIGILTGIVGGLIVAIYTYIFMTMIAPEMLDSIRDAAMAGAGDMDSEQEETAGKIMDTMLSPGVMASMVVVMKFFLGLFVGLIAGMIMKEENPLANFE